MVNIHTIFTINKEIVIFFIKIILFNNLLKKLSVSLLCRMLRYVLFILLLFPMLSLAGGLDRIKRAIEKGDYEKAFELIEKNSEKEPKNPGLNYFRALIFQTSTFHGYNLDSARLAVNIANNDIFSASDELIEELREDGVTTAKIDDLQAKIRDFQFQQLLEDVSIENVKLFRLKYPSSVYDDLLEYKRDSIIFLQVKLRRNKSSLDQFINDYPTSVFRPDASKILDTLRFEELLESKKLSDYYTFLKDYPKTNFVEKVEDFILKKATLDHLPNSYLQFLNMAKTTKLRKKACDLLYYIPSQENIAISSHPFKDSLHQQNELLGIELFPVLDRNEFGFYSSAGMKQIEFEFGDVQYKLKCEIESDEWALVYQEAKGLIIDKLGNIILSDVTNYSDLGNGAALVKIDGSDFLYHKSGFKILNEPVQKAEVLSERWIRVLINDKYHLVSFQGIPITESDYDDISIEGSFWVFEKRGLIAVYTEQLILDELHTKGLSLEFKFDDIELIGDGMFIGFRNDKECLLDLDLNFLIPWGAYEIHPDQSGWYLKSALGYQLYNSSKEEVMDDHYPYLESNAGWLILKSTNDWMLLSRQENILPSRGYDSLKIINEFAAYTSKEGNEKIIFSSGMSYPLSGNDQIKTFLNRDYLSIKNKKTTLYNRLGESVLSGKFDQITFLNDSILKVEEGNNQGLMNVKGEFLLKPIFTFIDEKEGIVFLLQNDEIGCFDLHSNVLFMPKYESRPEKIDEFYSLKLDGKYGLINKEEQTILNFEFEEISFWNDTSFLVKKDGYYSIVSHSNNVIIEGLEAMNRLLNTEDEVIWKFVKDGKYGLISNQNEILLEPEFNDIFNIGNVDNPIFFADQHLDKAGFHVVSYVSKEGELILSKAYTKDEFNKVLCED